MSEKRFWPIDEFASFELIEDEKEGKFTITLKGKIKYSGLVAAKIGEIIFTKDDVDEYLSGSGMGSNGVTH